MELYDKIQECKDFIISKFNNKIDFGVVLGSGLSNFTTQVDETIIEFEYKDLPHFKTSTVKGHSGKLIIGKIGEKTIICQSGRFHYYEGYNMNELTFPIRVFKSLGISKLILTNASGSLNDGHKVGDIVILKDHINLQPSHPLRGTNDNRLGDRFPDMMNTYNSDMYNDALKYSRSKNYRVSLGVYVGVQGPTFETPSEYKYYHLIGGDCVGMSTVPEVIVARHSSMEVFCLSIIADLGYPPEKMKVISHNEVLEMTEKSEPIATDIVKYIINKY